MSRKYEIAVICNVRSFVKWVSRKSYKALKIFLILQIWICIHVYVYCNVLRGMCVIYKTSFGLDDWIYCHLIHTTRNYRHTLQFTVTQALGFSVLNNRILATGLQSHCNLKLYMKSFHRLISILPLFCNCQFRRLDSIQFLCSQAHIPVGWRLETQLNSTLLNWTFLYNDFAPTTQKTQPLLLRRCVYSAAA
jgi:hypothetical protein